jgi:glutamate synthase domain-containing protein 2/glutamate synthase domain-containing protein 1/glutamate synthase domain-containing protein 3
VHVNAAAAAGVAALVVGPRKDYGRRGEMEHVDNYRGTAVKMAHAEKVRLEIGVSNHFVEPTVQPSCAPPGPARSARQGDGAADREDLPDSPPAKKIRRPSRRWRRPPHAAPDTSQTDIVSIETLRFTYPSRTSLMAPSGEERPMETHDRRGPAAQGLYRPEDEHDACGVGFVAHVKGRRSHDIVRQALDLLINLEHRGACGSDPGTGDGAGILVQMPDAFLRAGVPFALPAPGAYGAGLVFLPTAAAPQAACRALVERIAADERRPVLGWRPVPTDLGAIGRNAAAVAPVFEQVFVGSREGEDAAAFERGLYILRKRIEHAAATLDLAADARAAFYIVSLSSKTLIYKGMLTASQIERMYPDLGDPRLVSALALVHQRFSTNTFPSWPLAHPYRMVAHNGEINTLRGNINWMQAREGLLRSRTFGDDLAKVLPVIRPGGSDTATFDNVLEFLVMSGRSLPHAVLMMIPEPWSGHADMDPAVRAFYEYHSSLMEPWDGPASIAFTDGTVIGAVLDRNGLRPSRYMVTSDDLVIMASEVGVLDVPVERIVRKDRLRPGRMLLVDTARGRIVDDAEIKRELAAAAPYGQWLRDQLAHIDDLPAARAERPDHQTVLERQHAFGYTYEDVRLLLGPMATHGEEPIGSMGTDTAPAVLSTRPRLLYDYFAQLFAQVTNPPLDAIREELITTMASTIGPEGNLLEPTPEACRQIAIPYPILHNDQVAKIRHLPTGSPFRSTTLPILYNPADGGPGLDRAMRELCRKASQAVAAGYGILILSDRGVDATHAPIPSLLATAGVHHHLVRQGARTRCGLLVESGDAREVHHVALLMGYGAGAVNPYLAFETLDDMIRQGLLAGVTHEQAVHGYVKALNKGVLKVMSKMGISTLQSYCGAQIFEAVGLDRAFVDTYFTSTPSRIGGIGLDTVAEEVRRRHERAFGRRRAALDELESGGEYQWRRDGEVHLFTPETVFRLQHATRTRRYEIYEDYTRLVDDQSQRLATLRGLFRLRPAGPPVPLDEVEPVDAILRRFSSGAMSYGSISQEAHETLAIAMNRLGARSNTGEGGEDPARYVPDANGDSRRSAIKQVASGRFGVTSEYLVNADDLQIKMAQGAKPGEGGQLPGHKVYPWIAKVRHSTPGVGLISPPPHHDIYSIEDLAQLIFDLKNANPVARVHVKLVAESGVGTVAAGVAKAHADVVLISGHDGGTGASPLTSLKHAGVPWELGLAETQQVLLLNGLRDRIVVQVDGQMKTGRDVVVAALLGAEEFGFATAPLVVMGCVMMRVCHLNTCPVGIATQDPELRKTFAGTPALVETFFRFIAEDVRAQMAALGFRSLDAMVGRVDCLDVQPAVDHWKARGLDLAPLLYQPRLPEGAARRRTTAQDPGLAHVLDHTLIAGAAAALEHGTPVELALPIRNTDRTAGTLLGYEVTRRYGGAGLPPDTIRVAFTGSAGQSFGAFLPRGITLGLDGDANDFVGKGLSGGRLVIRPPEGARFAAEQNVIIGNVALYGATGGEAFIRGVAGERFAVRNSGAHAVVEGVGDHGCEYMTGGRVVVLGATGRNFAAGMSGGLAFVLDTDGAFRRRCNPEMVDLDPLDDEAEIDCLHEIVARHALLTGSVPAQRLLAGWPELLARVVVVTPRDFKRVRDAETRGREARAAAGDLVGA